MKSQKANAHLHLTLDERRIILSGIINASSKTAIAETIGKDKSTIAKEIKKHRILKIKCRMPLECSNYRKCTRNRTCTTNCPGYKPFRCSRRDRSPGACNGCLKYNACRFDKYCYVPETAQREYQTTLRESREGINLTYKEAKRIGDLISPLLKNGLSPYQVLQTHPDLGICEKTIYNYIENGVFTNVSGLYPSHLRQQLSRKLSKAQKVQFKKREDRRYLKGRSYKDFLAYKAEHPNTFITQMDTVYNDVTNGPFIQTFKCLPLGLFLAIYHENKTAQAMLDGINLLEKWMGTELFRLCCEVILTDRGSEFTLAEEMEKQKDGARRTRLFYCDPMQSGQKGTLEKKHVELRYILPKKTDLKALGLVDQDALNRVLVHLNSVPHESLHNKTAFEMTQFLCPELYKRLVSFGIYQIPKEEVILRPYLLKK
ncbi:MAG: helix-turn-helix domain-containing protein [Gallicola sp.]|nr:helix-turn-helix domain-containing protein [Gallicola sp.]